MPLVSVLLPVYNDAVHLPDALAGLDAQTFQDFELIACDDGSNDGTSGILADASVRTVTHAANMGAAAAINSAAAPATGRLLTWVSSDNVMHPGWLEVLSAEMSDPDVGAVYSAYRRIEVGCKPRVVCPGVYNPARLIAGENCFFGPSFLIRREVWQPHRGQASHDYQNWATVEEACWSAGLAIRYIDRVLCDYHAGPWCTVVRNPGLYDADRWRAGAIERRKSLPPVPRR